MVAGNVVYQEGLCQQKDMHFILYLWGKVLKVFSQESEIIGNTF